MPSSPKNKKQKIDLAEVSTKCWEHYRNYLDSLEEGDGDIDELQELIELAGEHVPPSLDNWTCPKDMLSILVSVAYNILADMAIGEFLGSEQDDKSSAQEIQNLLTKSLNFYPENAATWSMGANFGRMSHRLSMKSTREWYKCAFEYAHKLRKKALDVLENECIEDPLVKEWVELLILNQVVGSEFEDEVDEAGEEDVEKEEEDDEEEGGEYSSSTVESTARFMLAMLSSMSDHNVARDQLKKFPLSHRLHPNVWSITSSPKKKPTSNAPCAFRPSKGILPENLYSRMKQVFAPDAVYWTESDYADRGYYSYFMDFEKDSQPKNLIEEIIVQHLLPRTRQVLSKIDSDQICGFEWWAHTRPIQANLGHNLHFDTDESMLSQQQKVTHPIMSSVLYLSGGDGAGNTILLDQTPDSTEVAESAWLGVPQDNSFMIFPGNLLHGVLPCPGSQMQKEMEENEGDCNSHEELARNWRVPPDEEETPNRLTFMVGFWTRNVPKSMKDRHLYGPCGPLPPNTAEHTWIDEIAKGYVTADGSISQNGDSKESAIQETMLAVELPRISPAWEMLQTEERSHDDPPLEIPHAIDHRFFVQNAPLCFRESLFEDHGEEC